ncbi:hypothetical protein ORI89_14080 [Sphingobacterium sp. UT-1RO-CII-1]|uniref:hypothetical protein n=1 Tax=Sphingobacterium sp. UT-1RO-CII-1 TaxID=2995225 RepID=UPI00227B8119|nr:hypothetical protein [Sphingobacterium sp. UT-1RO-CII-1]MCY4780783.1 hypothetical protein [Sphingobacterium sp. UT-1RO-CII-1]
MKKLFKNFNILGLVAFIAAGIFAISWTEIKKSDPNGLFYEVELIDINQPATDANLKIKGLYPGSTPGEQPVGDCEEPSGTLCAIKMNIADGDNIPVTVEEAATDGLIEARLHRASL